VLDWLLDDRISVGILLGVVAGVLAAFWWRTRKRSLAWAAAAAALLLLTFLGFSLLWDRETDRQQVARKVEELAAACQARDGRQLARNISPEFRSPRGQPRDEFCRMAEEYLQRLGIREVAVWGIKVEELSRANRAARVHFSGKARGKEEYPAASCEAEFRLDPDNEWRLKGFKIFFPSNTTQEFALPF
jgi:hypothetical protein